MVDRVRAVAEDLNTINGVEPVNDGGGPGALWAAGRPRVLQVVPALETGGGGVERSTIDVAGAIIEAGGTAVVASSGGVRSPFGSVRNRAGPSGPIAVTTAWRARSQNSTTTFVPGRSSARNASMFFSTATRPA